MKSLFYYLWAVPGLVGLGAPSAGAQTPTWQRALALAAGTTSQAVLCSATTPDAAGNTVVAGSFQGVLTLGPATLTSAGGRDIFVARLGPAGQWVQAVRAGGSGDDQASALLLAPNGDLVVAGSASGSPATFGSLALNTAGTDAFVARLSLAGEWTQAIQAGGSDADRIEALTLDAAGQVVAVGSFSSITAAFGPFTLSNASSSPLSSRTPDVFVARLNAAGQWTQAVSCYGDGPDGSARVAAYPDGSVLVAGVCNGTGVILGSTSLPNPSPTRGDIFMGRLSTAGQWSEVMRVGGADDEQLAQLMLDAAGGLTLAGSFASTSLILGATTLLKEGSPDPYVHDVFVARRNPAGQWVQAARAGGPGDEWTTALVVNPNGTATVAGYFGSATSSFGPFTLPNAEPAAATTDLFVAQLAAAGTWTAALSAGGPGNQQASALTADGRGGATLVGYSGGPSVTFGPVMVASPNVFYGLVGQLAGLPTATRQPQRPALGLWPNPAHTTATLSWPSGSALPGPVLMFDALGREVRRHLLPAHATTATLSVAGLAPGVYSVHCGAAVTRLVVE